MPIPTPSGLSASDPLLKKWAVAARLPFLTASVLPVVAATAAAWWDEGAVSPSFAILCLVGITFIHAGSNLANDYFDHLSGSDAVNRFSTPFSGGSRVIQEDMLSARAVLAAALVCTGFGAALGAVLWHHTPGNTLLYIGLAGIALGWFYTAPPLRLAHRGLGELTVGVAFGILPALGAEWAQRGRLTFEVGWAGVPAGLLVAAILLINELPDVRADGSVGKRTLAVRLGPRRAAALYALLLVAAYGAVGAGILLGWMPPLAGLVALVAPLSWRVIQRLRAHYADVHGLLPAMGATILQQAVFLLILTGAYLADLALR